MASITQRYDVGGVMLPRPFKIRRLGHFGFNVFKLTDRKPERAYTLEEIRTELPSAVATIQFREKYDVWVKGLRAKAHIEYRSS